MEAQIRPEPSREERAAILAAVERLAGDAPPPGYQSAWRAAGVRENLDEAEELD